MTSRKINGRARRATVRAKTSKVDQVVADQNQPLQRGQMQKNNETMIRDEGTTRCNHGLVPSNNHWHGHEQFVNSSNNMKLCQEFLQAFVDEFDGAAGDFLVSCYAEEVCRCLERS
eukprot:scaffold1446_cov145-Skeletonema_menzelii.AAC.3